MNKFNKKRAPFRKGTGVVAAAATFLFLATAAGAAERTPERDRLLKERRQAAARRAAEQSPLETPPALKESARIPAEEVKVGDSRITDAAVKATPEGPGEMRLERERAKYPR